MSQRVNLHEELKRHAFNHAVICTYTFDSQFFEGYCLDRFAALRDNGNITVVLDRGTYDGLVAGPVAQWPRLANVRYLLHPVKAPRTFHPKVFLLATRTRGLLAVGSANFTKPGLGSNAELVGVYRFEKGKREQHRNLFGQAVRFLRALAAGWPGVDLGSNLDELVRDADWLGDGSEPGPGRLIHSLDGPLWPTICEGITAPVDAVHILSRYFDAEPALLDSVAATLRPRTIGLWTQNGITTMTSAWLRHPLVTKGTASIRLCSYNDDGHRQPLHAKAVMIVTGKTARLAFGSANFTSAGMFSPASRGNVEAMLLLDGLPSAACDPAKLFDPSRSAVALQSAAMLQTAPRDERPTSEAALIELESAAVENGRLECRCAAALGDATARIRTAVLALNNAAEIRVRLRQRSETAWFGGLDQETLRRCDEETTVVHLEGHPEERLSNRVLLANLQDIVSGRGQRRERRIYEAQRSAAQFTAALEDILRNGDTEGLIRFLTLCDIPLVDAARPLAFQRPRAAWTGDEEMRRLGERNLREYASLHDAVVGFCERHLRRLRRHLERPSTAGAPNFMHIALAVGHILRAQLERALVGFEHRRTPMTVSDWHEHRARLDCYLDLFKADVDLLYGEYLPALSRRYKRAAIREVIQPDLEPLGALAATFLAVRDRINACVKAGLCVQTPSGKTVEPFIHTDNIIGPRRWEEWRQAVGSAVEHGEAWRRADADVGGAV
ncbi:hypothetical protein WMF30_02840 [Sorangium sp. So ce134]